MFSFHGLLVLNVMDVVIKCEKVNKKAANLSMSYINCPPKKNAIPFETHWTNNVQVFVMM